MCRHSADTATCTTLVNEAAVAEIAKDCGIAPRSADSSLVSATCTLGKLA